MPEECAKCGYRNAGSGKFCPECGAPLVPPTADSDFEQLAERTVVADLGVALEDADTRLGGPSEAASEPEVLMEDAATVVGGPSEAASQWGAPDRTSSPRTLGTGRTGPLEVGEAFGARYHIIRLLGAGGMGAVYQAWDSELGVAVALKVIKPPSGGDAVSTEGLVRRFKRELLLSRQVTHPNVVRIHDLGEIDGIKYLTMTYIDGEDLSALLSRSGHLPLPRALAIAREVADGLRAAHQAGVVHRDLKPANIMISEDEALIMDFGIALSVSRGKVKGPTGPVTGAADSASGTMAGTSGGQGGPVTEAAASQAGPVMGPTENEAGSGGGTIGTRTGTSVDLLMTEAKGGIVGTLAYMAPEQARGEPADHRADIYAFGLILHNMLVGRSRPDRGSSPMGELAKRLKNGVPDVRSVDPQIPETVARVVARCLEIDPGARYQETADLVADLNRLDENGKPLPLVRRLTPRLMATSALLVMAMLGGTYFLTRRAVEPPKEHEPITVLIADFENGTGEAAFDRTLEPMLRRALEAAGFISAYDRSRIRSTFGAPPPEKLDGGAARELALKQGVGVVLSGSIERRGSGYEISARAVQTVTGNEIASARSRASSKDQILGAATKLVASVRTALGDETSDSVQLLAMKTLSTTSMEVAGYYAAAIEAQSNNKFEEARQNFLKAVERDPSFGLGYQGLSLMSSNLGKLQDAEKYATEALRHLDGMTGRERFAVRASYYMNTGDAQQCVKEYGELIGQYAADAVAHNNRGVCLAILRKMSEAVTEMGQAVQILPKRVPFRANLAIHMAYAGDFQAAEEEVGKLDEPTDMATLALAFAQLGQGQLKEAAATYQKLGTIGARGAFWAASGMGDLALYEGRFSDAVRLFEQGAASDLASKNADRAARKLTSLAYAQLMQGQKRLAVAAAEKALLNSQTVPIRFLAARIFVEANAVARARAIAKSLSAELPAEPQAYGKIVEGEIALKSGDPRQAIKILTDAGDVLDTWLGHFDLGRAYLELGAFPQADSEFDRCIKRRGEALSLLVDEEPTSGYFPLVYYYQGRVREGLKNPAFVDSYRSYLNIRGKSTEDPLLPEVRRRAGAR